ncbi:error-prone DNA polymerase [Corynebacterium pelargi]|uniref:Error-prone DNA polymerase n=1 Tax=Corynebacterium pelargi TaxID=1471400 RepID=A0A410WAK1_9CORY|nr:error-prone DNA polymerase [Corynebacterium pelargi]QAU53013.1 Error-prone DNA polymerase [Corynebacterium pelargi]GGG75442.1 error-prone DNA polymerase [Corynebacterium pelargi]
MDDNPTLGICGGGLNWADINSVLNGTFEKVLVPASHRRRLRTSAFTSVEGSGEQTGSGGQASGGVQAGGGVRVGGVQAGSGGAELHAKSSFAFLEGASSPEEYVEAAQALGLSALCLMDRDGLYGAMEFALAAADAGIQTVFGAELGIDPTLPPLPVLCKSPEGYRRLSLSITQAAMRTGEKGKVAYPSLELLAQAANKQWYVLLPAAWHERATEVVEAFGAHNVLALFESTMCPTDCDDHEVLADLCQRYGIRGIVSGSPTAAYAAHARLAGAKAGLRQRASLAQHRPHTHPAGGSWLKAMPQVAASVVGGVALLHTTDDVAKECAFALDLLIPALPHWDVPDGHTEMSWLRHLVCEGVQQRYVPRYRGDEEALAKVWAQIHHELNIIEQLGFPGYFLIVHDIVQFCHRSNILCQGRGSAANSVVCFALGITNVDPIAARLLFERFLSPERDGPPDIDIDIESTRREEVIQYVYRRYGRDNAAQVANLITYRRRGALRDASRALGYPQGSADGWAKGFQAVPEDVDALAQQFLEHPRHLGIHSGGMVICDRPIANVVPVEWARMEGRSVVQWDKESCAAAGLVKFDLLGLGMLEALHHMIDLVEEQHGRRVNLWELDLAEAEIYAMLSRGDAVGVFQVESRAQMATLPRLKPREFFDLVVEVALIRPGPIQGGSVHPYIRRRNGLEPVEYDHPILRNALEKTLGIPLFQEQLMQMAVDAAGFSGAEADELRRAMGSKRSPKKMAAMKQRFYQGLANNGIDGEVAHKLWNKIVAFAAYGFPESHSQSFASLVYFSAWFKYHYPAEFCVGLLRAQPMGFYSPQSLLADAKRHGVATLPIDVNCSQVEASIEQGAIRLGLNLVKGLGEKAAAAVVAHAPYQDVGDLARRADLGRAKIEALARAGALERFGSRRQALWQAGTVEHAGMLPGLAVEAPSLPGMTAFELMASDIASTGVSEIQPIEMLREWLDTQGVLKACDLLTPEDGTRIRIAGVITHRQRPKTAQGVTFLGMEDETGLMNIVVSVGLWERSLLARSAKAVMVRGIVQNQNGVASIVADKFEPLPLAHALSRGSRDFR